MLFNAVVCVVYLVSKGTHRIIIFRGVESTHTKNESPTHTMDAMCGLELYKAQFKLR